MKYSMTYLIVVLCMSWVYSQETEQQKEMAAQMAEYMNVAWEASPEDGLANIRILMLQNDEPYAGKTSIHGRFQLKISGPQTHMMRFNPNANGRYVVEEIEAGTYNLFITGRDEMEGFSWGHYRVKLSAGSAPIIQVQLE